MLSGKLILKNVNLSVGTISNCQIKFPIKFSSHTIAITSYNELIKIKV